MIGQTYFSALSKRLRSVHLILILLILSVTWSQGCARWLPGKIAVDEPGWEWVTAVISPGVTDSASPREGSFAAADGSRVLQEGRDGAEVCAVSPSQEVRDRKASSLKASGPKLVGALETGVRSNEAEPSPAEEEGVGRDGAPMVADQGESASSAGDLAGQGEPIYDIPVELNEQVQAYIETFTGPHRSRFQTYLCRSARYISMMREILREHGLPEDLVYMALIESGFSTHAYSRARAVGPWQFIRSTAKVYGLRTDWWVDERRDPVKSTRAACRYLKSLYGRFDSWLLAMAAYNGGDVRVKRAIRLAKTKDFWELAKTPYLKRETKNYVPQVIAATIVAKNRERYQFTDLPYAEPLAFDEVRLDDAMDLKVVAKLAGASYRTIRALNPELLRTATPPRRYAVRVPAGTQSRFLQRLAGASSERWITWRKYKIRRGDTLSFVATRFGTSVEAIMKANKLRDSRIVAGRSLMVPLWVEEAASPAEVAGLVGEDEPSGGNGKRVLTHVISKGENLGRIARNYDTSVRAIMDANGLKSAHRVIAGKTLVIPVLDDGASSPVKLDRPVGASRVTSSPELTEVPTFHVVQAGETLWQIAQTYSTTVAALQHLNGISNPGVIRAGEQLRVSSREDALQEEGRQSRDESGQDDAVHVVKKGETLWHIAEAYGVGVRALQSWNGLAGNSIIRPGDRLKVVLVR